MRFSKFYKLFTEAQSIRIKQDDTMFTAYIKGRVAGKLIVDRYAKPLAVFKVVTNEPYRRMGVATAMYNAAEAAFGPLVPSGVTSDEALGFWNKRRPGSMDSDLRLYKSYLLGKEVSDMKRTGIVRDVGSKGVSALINGKQEGEMNSIFYTKNIQHLLPDEIYKKVYGE